MGLECRVATRLECSRTIYQYILRFYGKSNAATMSTTLYSLGGGGGVLGTQCKVYVLAPPERPPFSTHMVRQITPLIQYGPTYDLIFSLVRQMTPIFRIWFGIMHVFWRLIHVRVLTPIFSLNVEFRPLYFTPLSRYEHGFEPGREPMYPPPPRDCSP